MTPLPSGSPLTPVNMNAGFRYETAVSDFFSLEKLSCIMVESSDPSSLDINDLYEIDYTRELGKGATGRVFKGNRRADGLAVAIKVMIRSNLSKKQIKFLVKEITSLKMLDHQNIVKLHNVYEDNFHFYIIMELVSGGELFHRIVKKKFYSEYDARLLCKIILQAIDHCHARNVIHRDIKPENLLMMSPEDDFNIKLCDFGFSDVSKIDKFSGYMGTPIFMAPEMLGKGSNYSKSIDMWSFGVVAYIILSGYPPFYGKTIEELEEHILAGRFVFHPEEWNGISQEAKDFISCLLCVDPKKRLTAEQALNHSWLHLEDPTLHSTDLKESLSRMKTFNAKRKIKAAILSVCFSLPIYVCIYLQIHFFYLICNHFYVL
jgi:serine/threonine protein kinase